VLEKILEKLIVLDIFFGGFLGICEFTFTDGPIEKNI
jgi:hypothetical protein